MLILANKCDLEDERKIETERGEEMAKEFKAQFAEVSARTGAGVDKVRMNYNVCMEPMDFKF